MTDFEEIYATYFDSVYQYVLSLCRDVHAAEEVTQESFCKAMTHLDRFDGRCRLYVWLCQIAKNTYLTHVRKQKRRAAPPEDEPSHPGFEGELLDSDSAWQLHRLLHDLNEPYKEVFSLRVFGELSFSQIGQLFGKSDSWARLIFYRAKAEKLLSAENSELVLARKRGDYLAVLLRMDSGGCGVDILERDSLFHDRWRGGPGSAGQPAGYLQVSDLGSSDEPLLVAYGIDLPESACWYTFEYANTTYTRPIVSRRVLDMFLPMDSVQPHYTITVTLLDENMQPIA